MSYLAETSNMTTRRTTAIAVTGLAPAGQAALQAATQMDTDGHRCKEESSLMWHGFLTRAGT